MLRPGQKSRERRVMTSYPLSGPAQVACGLLVAWALSERVGQWMGLSQPVSADREKSTIAVLQLAYFGAILFGLADAALLRWTTVPRALEPWCWAGVPLAAAGIFIRIAARLTLGRQFSGYVQTSPSHRLVTTGVYRWVQHPLYVGYLLLLIGLAISFGSGGALGITLVAGVPALVWRIRVEERALATWFGEEYDPYRRRTKRMIPGVW
jgi:protein-S-isoprenylcysteine O-methyltransferase Ste14